MPNTFLRTKFYVSHPRPGLVPRPQLVERFSAGLARPITLLSAPAGYGKSTLLSMWVEKHKLEQERSESKGEEIIAWLSLDAQDNDPDRFWEYVIAALCFAQRDYDIQHAADTFQDLLTFLQTGQQPTLSFIDSLMNTLMERDETYILVLDDYHFINMPKIHEDVTYLLDHQPHNLRLIFATRVDPPFPLSRLRGRGLISEFRAADLRFTLKEAEVLLKGTSNCSLLPENVLSIEKVTEGWPAGLYMAALAWQSHLSLKQSDRTLQEQLQQFLLSFTGNHAFIIDYLADEVFNRQPEHIRDFLLKTSILERMSAALCNELVRDEDHIDSQEILEYIFKSNLFIISLDNERKWFRYHHLFADLLRARLCQREPDRAPELHGRASQWYERMGMPDEAIHHALKAPAQERAAALIEQHVEQYLTRGELVTVMKWVENLPTGLLNTRPVLCMKLAWALVFASKTDRAGALLRYAEEALAAWDLYKTKEGPVPVFMLDNEEEDKVRGTLMVLKGYLALLNKEPVTALQIAQAALPLLNEAQSKESAYLHWLAGYACRGLGDMKRAVSYQAEAVSISRTLDAYLEEMLFLTDLGISHLLLGRLALSKITFMEALTVGGRQKVHEHGYQSRVEAYLSSILLEQNFLEEALNHSQKAVDYVRKWPSSNYTATAYCYYGLALITQGELDDAEEAIMYAEMERRNAPLNPFINSLLAYALMRLYLAKADWVAAEKLAEELAAEMPKEVMEIDEYGEKKLIAYARFRLKKGSECQDERLLNEALLLITRLELAAMSEERVHSLIEILVLKAVCLYVKAKPPQDSDSVEALIVLERSLLLGVREGYFRVFINEGQVMAEMLGTILSERSAISRNLNNEIKSYITKLLAALSIHTVPVNKLSERNDYVEKLTERELEVLDLMAQGLRNKEMAKRLFVSEGTIKTHVHHIISKLGAQNRTQAINRANELGLQQKNT